MQTSVEWVRSDAWRDNTEVALPMLPALATDVLRLAMDPDVSAMRITTVVAKDQVLATLVIRLANSAFSAPADDISSINEAVVRVGTSAVRNAVVAECLASRLQSPDVYGTQGRALVDHSIGAAYLASLIAEDAGESPEEAFLYGLLHDIGKLLILKLAHDSGRQLQPSSEEDLAELIAEKHAEFGGYLLEQWKLSERLVDPVVWHHQPDQAEQHPRAAAVAAAANRLAHRYGFGCSADTSDPLLDPVMLSVGFNERRLAHIDAYAPGLFEIARQIVR
jgi:putative nucleotidyltransferase with HDIG domain